jgi:hypothetical protein
MKTFNEFHYDPNRGRTEVQELRDRLSSSRSFRERKDVLPFFRKRPHLSALCGRYNHTLVRGDRIAWEYEVFGLFSDIVVGDSQTKSYTFVEFEDAAANSVFVKHGDKAEREWSPRFLRGFAQLVDWFRKLDDRRHSDEFEARFGKRSIDCMGVLVVGRDQYLDVGERLRLEWWRENIVVHSRRIHCVTYDELVANFLRHADEAFQAPSPSSGSGPAPWRRRKGRRR